MLLHGDSRAQVRATVAAVGGSRVAERVHEPAEAGGRGRVPGPGLQRVAQVFRGWRQRVAPDTALDDKRFVVGGARMESFRPIREYDTL